MEKDISVVVGHVRGIRVMRDGNTRFVVSGKKFRESFLVATSCGEKIFPEGFPKRALIKYRKQEGSKQHAIIEAVSEPGGVCIAFHTQERNV